MAGVATFTTIIITGSVTKSVGSELRISLQNSVDMDTSIKESYSRPVR